LTLARILIERSPRLSERTVGDDQSLGVESAHQLAPAVALVAEQVAGGHARLAEEHVAARPQAH
jgi:hypothetical protein